MARSKTYEIVAHPGMLTAYFFLTIGFFFTVVFQVWRGFFLPADLSPEQLLRLKMIIYTCCFGGVGGTTYSIYGLYKHTVQDDFDKKYFYWFIFRGPLGALLGVIMYFLVEGGLLALSEEFIKDNFRAKALLVGAAYLAGFSTNQFIAKLKDLSHAIFGTQSHKNKPSS